MSATIKVQLIRIKVSEKSRAKCPKQEGKADIFHFYVCFLQL